MVLRLGGYTKEEIKEIRRATKDINKLIIKYGYPLFKHTAKKCINTVDTKHRLLKEIAHREEELNKMKKRMGK